MPLNDESEEFRNVSERVLSTLTQAEITRIDRIQNRLLWHKYIAKGRQMYDFAEGILNEEFLFHGSRKNDPALIYKGDQSFDMRFCISGMWGRGNYFAKNASYSNNYAFTSGSAVPCRVILAAWVLTGHSFHSSPNGSLTKPPPRDDDPVTEGTVMRHYDSVNGTTEGSKVYITYDNTLAYPAYRIAYTLH